MENDNIYVGEETRGIHVNKVDGNTLGALSLGLIRKQGKTLCQKIHMREFKDR